MCTNQKLRVALPFVVSVRQHLPWGKNFFHGERTEQLVKDAFVQPCKPGNVQPGGGKANLEALKAVQLSVTVGLQLPAPGTAQENRNIPAQQGTDNPSTEQPQHCSTAAKELNA